MKKSFPKFFISLLTALLFFACAAKSSAEVKEYEFLTPDVVVLKSVQKPELSASELKGVINTGYWFKENALLREADGNIQRKPDVTCFFYVIFKEPFKAGEIRNISSFTIKYDPVQGSNIFKLNQVGYGIKQKKKIAYIGAWLGTLGALPLQHLAGQKFEIRNSSNHSCVYSNIMKLRPADPRYKNGEVFTGEEVLELDFSEFNTPGQYYIYAENIGRSADFIIGPEVLNEAFYIHARGLYHKRCGIAKTQPFTAWESPQCHIRVSLGRFPGNAEHYRIGHGEKTFGFFDHRGNRIEVKHFDLIKDNPPYKDEYITAPGGWHDAADYDRRPYHLRIVSDLAMVYLMKPENFIDGQLNIPESGNGIPDILDEAAWGLKHLLAAQQPDGGVGTWFETVEHPGVGEGLPDRDQRSYHISAVSRNGTLEYAAAASTLAWALQKAGAQSDAEKYLASAVKAWNFAMDPRKRLIAYFVLKDHMISYMEDARLDGGNLLKAGVTLYALTSDKQYLAAVLDEQKRIADIFNKDFWKWSPLNWMALELCPVDELRFFYTEYRKIIISNADKMLAEQENAYPYRTLWYASDAGWVHTMGWGNYHPLRRAVTLIAAHKFTGEEKYLTGAYIANDFHNGANPLGRSMTSNLGRIYPVVFLDLVSYNGKFKEFVPGITPYGNTFGIDRNALEMVYKDKAGQLPIFRRYINLEFLSVPASEYSVWETISPAAVVSGYLIESPALPTADLKNRKPADDFRRLPGYLALP